MSACFFERRDSRLQKNKTFQEYYQFGITYFLSFLTMYSRVELIFFVGKTKEVG